MYVYICTYIYIYTSHFDLWRDTVAAGFVNALQLSPNGRFIMAAVGQEHRLGRWSRIAEARNGVIKLPLCLEEEGLYGSA